jgi:phi13 family phage major tail protein
MAIIGLEKLCYAKIIKDDANGLTFETPKYLPGIKEIKIAPKSNTEKLYAENKLWEQSTSLQDVEVTVNLADLSNAEAADLLGQTVATEGGVFASADDTAPYIALLYKANKSNGKARYGVLYKGKMELPDDSAKGMEGKTDFQTPEMKSTFQPLQYNGRWKYQVDEDDPDCPTDIDTKFFASVIVPTKKTSTVTP